jgi:DNA-binding NtrC family response regulator
VLLVDDETALGRAVSQYLRLRGFEVSTAVSGDDAMAIVRSEHIDVLVADFRLGDMRGDVVYELASAIQPQLREHTLFMTGDMSENTARDIAATRRPLLRKPFTLEHLREAIDQLHGAVGRHQGSQ